MEVREALGQISEIRQQMARNERFRGYDASSVAAIGLLGMLAAAAQPHLVPAPAEELRGYLSLWLVVASAALLWVGSGLWRRVRASGSAMTQESTLLSVEQLLPSIGVGALLTLAIFVGAPEASWMLPGLWSLLFSLGVFASHRRLPRGAFWVGVYFAACGFASLLWGRGAHAYSPWQMGLSFGGGMLLSAAVLRWNLRHEERPHV